ncbi:MAG: hypothetical protein LBQ95_03010 [Lachnospiraceae bacterium]|jgi:hypothetical protein|nr:hypothetical protein [Lachnospiraceae bacterium]
MNFIVGGLLVCVYLAECLAIFATIIIVRDEKRVTKTCVIIIAVPLLIIGLRATYIHFVPKLEVQSEDSIKLKDRSYTMTPYVDNYDIDGDVMFAPSGKLDKSQLKMVGIVYYPNEKWYKNFWQLQFVPCYVYAAKEDENNEILFIQWKYTEDWGTVTYTYYTYSVLTAID